MSMIIRSLPAFKLHVKVLIKQIYHLSHSDRNIALKFMDMFLKQVKLSLFNASHKLCRRNNEASTHSKCEPLKKTFTFKATKYRIAKKTNTLRRIRNALTLKSLTDSLNLDENQSPVPETDENCIEDMQLNVSNTKEDHEDNQYFTVPIYYEDNENVDLNTSDKDDFIVASDTTVPNEDFPIKIKQDAESLRKFNCHVCNTLLDSYSLLLEHLFNHNVAPRSCIKCKNSFPNAIPYKIHLNSDCLQYASASSNVVFSHFVAITENLENKLKDILICPHCGIRFSKLFNLRRHLARSCGEAALVKSPKQFECHECHTSFTSMKILEKHKKSHKGDDKQCFKCDSIFPTRKLLRAHFLVHQEQVKVEKYRCHPCDITFQNRVSYRNHIKSYKNDPIHEDQGVHSTRIWCHICKKSFYDQYTYNRHCKRKNHLQINNPYEDLSENKPIICEKCGVTFLTETGLSTHNSKIHMDREPMKCDKCDYSSNSKTNLQRHVFTIHQPGYKRYACDKCPAMFTAASAVKEHINSVHSDLRLFSCETCLKAFKLKRQLTRHKAIHIMSMPFSCAHCSMGFKRRTHLTRHTKSKHKEHLPNDHGMDLDSNDMVQEMQKGNKLTMSQPVITTDTQNMQEDRVFSLIDAQSGELVTLSATELSKTAVINMSDGALLNEVHLPELWNHPTTTIYSLDPLQGDVLPQTEYNIITHDRPEMAHVLQKTLQNQMPKEAMHYCIPQSSHQTMEHLTVGTQSLNAKVEIPYMCVCVFENSGAQHGMDVIE